MDPVAVLIEQEYPRAPANVTWPAVTSRGSARSSPYGPTCVASMPLPTWSRSRCAGRPEPTPVRSAETLVALGPVRRDTMPP